MTYGIIYKAINKVNNKPYIGQTVSALNDRISKHFYDGHAKKGKDNSIFHKALMKYGKDNFIWEIVCTCNSKEELDEKENFHIKQFNSHYKDGVGYNMTYGGESSFGYKHAEATKQKMRQRTITTETRKKLSVINKGKKLSLATREKMSIARRGKSVSKATREKLRMVNTGKHHSEETKEKLRNRIFSVVTREKMSIAASGRSPWNKGKNVIPSELWIKRQAESHCKTYEINNNGNILTINNLAGYCRSIGINKSSLMSAIRRGDTYKNISIKLIK